jgi:hypothetical protein
MGRILLKTVIGLVLLAALAYGGDGLVLYISKHQFGTVLINRYYVVAEKYGKYDYSIAPPVLERCVYALFPHSGSQPCWYLEKHQLRLIRIGS